MRTKLTAAVLAALLCALAAASAAAKDAVKVGFIGPLTGGVSANGIGGRNSAELAVKLRNADAKTKYDYQFVVLDDECKPNVAVQAATKMAADSEIIAAATHYCSATAIATVDTYHKFGLPVIVWGAVLPDITYRNKYAEIHRVNGTMINQNEANAQLISKLGYKTVAVIHDTTDYGKGHNEYFSKALAAIGKTKIVGTFGVTADQHMAAACVARSVDLSADELDVLSRHHHGAAGGAWLPAGGRNPARELHGLGRGALWLARPGRCTQHDHAVPGPDRVGLNHPSIVDD